MPKYRTSHKVFAAWEYEKEIEFMNRQSEKGWQAVKVRRFSSKYMFDDSVRYRYQADYQSRIDDPARYIETYREQGWEHINDVNGWHYFRKVYDPALPESEYEIFTDSESLREMRRRWVRLGALLTAILAVVFASRIPVLIASPSFPNIFLTALIVFEAVIIGIGTISLAARTKSSRKGQPIFGTFLVLIIAGLIASLFLTSTRLRMNMNNYAEDYGSIPAELSEATSLGSVYVKLPSTYLFDIRIKADAPITFTLTDSNGSIAYTVRSEDMDRDNIRVWLSRGEHELYLSDYPGGSLDFCINID